MKSIQSKLLLGITFILSMFIVGILIYSFTFNYYFEYQKTKEMKKIISTIEFNDINDDDFNDYIVTLSNEYSVEIDIKDKDNNILFSSHKGGRKSLNSVNRFDIIDSKMIDDDIQKEIYTDKSTGVKFLSLSKASLDEKYNINVSIAINAIDDSKQKSLLFLMIIFIPTTIIAIILAVIFSKKFTMPIIKITEKTSKISNLQFDNPIDIKTSDEIGVLAGSVNALSSKIQNSLKELSKKNDELNKMLIKERKDENLRREFISSVSHELKSPIAVISGYAQMLDSKVVTSTEDIDYYINIINEESNRMSIIVNDLLDIYKMQSLNFKLDKTYFYIDDLIKNIVSKNDIKFKENNIRVDQDILKVQIYGDEIRIEQVIQNYLSNAISHVDQNKKIKIRVSKPNDNKVRVSVFNTGKNISSDDINIIWNGFVRGDKVRNHKEKRIGLGLYIVATIVKLHDGKYGVINKSDGVEFWFELNYANC